MTSHLLFLPLVVLITATFVRGQTYSAGICPTYQTSAEFDNSKIGRITDQQGYSVVMYAGIEERNDRKCLRLRLLNRSKYVLSYIDNNDNIISNQGSYSTESSGFTGPGFLQLRDGTPGVMGSDIFGNTRIHPIVLGDSADVYIGCTSYGLYYSESVFVVAPYSQDVTEIDIASIKHFLSTVEIPFVDQLRVIDQTCDVPGAVFVDPDADAAVDTQEGVENDIAQDTAVDNNRLGSRDFYIYRSGF